MTIEVLVKDKFDLVKINQILDLYNDGEPYDMDAYVHFTHDLNHPVYSKTYQFRCHMTIEEFMVISNHNHRVMESTKEQENV